MKSMSRSAWLRMGRSAGWIDDRGMVVAEAAHRPPKAWFDKKMKEIKEGNEDYSDETARKVVGDIWYNELSDSKRQEIYDRHGEGKSPNK